MLRTFLLVAALLWPQVGFAAGEGSLAPWRSGVGGQTGLGPGGEEPPAENPASDAGAALPITYTLAALGGTPRYVSTTGSGSACTVGAPCATITAAVTAATAGDPVVMLAGTYKDTLGSRWTGSSYGSDQFITKASIQLYAESGQTVTIDGSDDITSGPWTSETVYKYTTYIDRVCTDGTGIVFCTVSANDNLNGDKVGKYPDQAWIDDVQIKQVLTKAELTTGEFWVDAPNDRIYMLATDVDGATTIDACGRSDFLTVTGANVTIKGIVVEKYCNPALRGGVIDISATADGFTMEDVEVTECAFVCVLQNGSSSDLVLTPTLRRVTIDGGNWVGILSSYASNVVWDALRITDIDRWDELAPSPTSGGIKATKTYIATLTSSLIQDISGKGVWFDQSNYKITIADSTIRNSGVAGNDACVFFEISDDFLLIDSLLDCPVKNALRMSGSSGLKVINSTIIGGPDVAQVVTDDRSYVGCSTTGIITATGVACNGFSSDRWQAASPAIPATMTWIPKLDLFQNVLVLDPTGIGFGGGLAALVIQGRHSSGADVPLATILHADTVMDCNLYRADGGHPIRINNPASTSATIGYATPQDFATAMAGVAPYPAEAGLETNSAVVTTAEVDADGVVSGLIDHDDACAVPTDAAINAFIAAGTKRYGTTY